MTKEEILNYVEENGNHYGVDDWGPYVQCDSLCFALENPVTLEEYKATLEHYKYHGYLSGCSHGQ